VTWRCPDGQCAGRAVLTCKATLDVPQTDAVALRRCRFVGVVPAPVSAHCQRELGLSTVRRLKSGRDDNLAAISERRNAVLHGIFDQRLQEERWHADTLQRWWHVDLDSASDPRIALASIPRYDSTMSSSRPSVVNSPSDRSNTP